MEKTAEQLFKEESHKQWIESASFSGGVGSLTRIPFVVQPAVFKIMEEYAQQQTESLRKENDQLKQENERLREAVRNCRQVLIWHTKHSQAERPSHVAAFQSNTMWAIEGAESALEQTH